jgi:hypothetical protein
MFGYKSKKEKLDIKLQEEERERILEEAKRIIDDKKEAEEKLKEEPFLNLKGLVQQEDGKIKIELDWDDDFILKLRQSGYTGVDDNAIIQKYLLELTASVATDLSSGSDYE